MGRVRWLSALGGVALLLSVDMMPILAAGKNSPVGEPGSCPDGYRIDELSSEDPLRYQLVDRRGNQNGFVCESIDVNPRGRRKVKDDAL